MIASSRSIPEVNYLYLYHMLGVADFYIDVLVGIIQTFPTQEKTVWFRNALSKSPHDVLAEDEKENILASILNDQKF